MAHGQALGAIRARGQVTIPKRVRRLVRWVVPSQPVTITVEDAETIQLKPIARASQIDWKNLWSSIRRARATRGKRGNLAAFIATDRQRP